MALIYCNESQAFILFPVLVLCRRTLNKNKKVNESLMDYRFKFVDDRASLWHLSLRPKILISYDVCVSTVKPLWLYCRPLRFPRLLLLLLQLLSKSIVLSTELLWSFPWVIIHGSKLFFNKIICLNFYYVIYFLVSFSSFKFRKIFF